MSDITRERIEKLMKRCQIGVRYRQVGDANDIMSDCYGTLGAMMSEIEALRDWKNEAIAQSDSTRDIYRIYGEG
jgi:hypothetical protein